MPVARSALVVIDAQRGLIDGFEDDWTTALPNIRDLIAAARAADSPVFWIQHSGRSTSHPLHPGAAGWALHPSLDGRPSDPRVDKQWSDAFQDTDLHAQLQAAAVTRLVIVGAQTEFCIDATVRRGASLGYQIDLAADAHTTSDNGVLTRQQIVDHHNQTLRDLAIVGTTIGTPETAAVTFA